MKAGEVSPLSLLAGHGRLREGSQLLGINIQLLNAQTPTKPSSTNPHPITLKSHLLAGTTPVITLTTTLIAIILAIVIPHPYALDSSNGLCRRIKHQLNVLRLIRPVSGSLSMYRTLTRWTGICAQHVSMHGADELTAGTVA
jgi:hypothetical protein